MPNSTLLLNQNKATVSEDEIQQVIADFLAMGHVDNIRAMFKQQPEYLELSGAILQDERFNVRLGMAVLFEYLIEECPGEMYRAIPSLADLLQHTQDWKRGEALTLLGIIGTPDALALARPFLDDPSPQVVEIAQDILQVDDE